MVPDSRDLSTAVTPIDGRKLIAVVCADMVGYSRLIGLDPDWGWVGKGRGHP